MCNSTIIYREECLLIKVVLLKLHDHVVLILVTGFNIIVEIINEVESCVVIITKEDA